MDRHSFPALIVDAPPSGPANATCQMLTDCDTLPARGGGVLVRVACSSLNYKDALAVAGNQNKVLRHLPIVPGIDLAGIVEDPGGDGRFTAGQPVILTGYGIGEQVSGGYAGFAWVKGDWLVPLPPGLTLNQAMAIGTAGFTAMLCVLALEDHAIDRAGEIVVTGATGGVGSMAISLLARRGWKVVASTGRVEQEADYLRRLGAAEIVPRQLLSKPSVRPLETERWAGAVDSVGGETLAGILRQMRYGGSVTACGLAGGMNLPASVLPFILRGVNLLGIDSVQCPRPLRERAWQRLAAEVDFDLLEQMTTSIVLPDVLRAAHDLLAGKLRGRTVVTIE